MWNIKKSTDDMSLVIGEWQMVIGQWICGIIITGIISSCSVSRQIGKQADAVLLKDTAIRTGHIGISIYEPATNTYWYNYNATKYFIPASNTKLFTLYAGMKFLGDSIPGFSIEDTKDTLYVIANGDPTFLHTDFKNQAFYNYLANTSKMIALRVNEKDRFEALGNGWAWNDYNETYMVERSRFPIYENSISFTKTNNTLQAVPPVIKYPYFKEPMIQLLSLDGKFTVDRALGTNEFQFKRSKNTFTNTRIPFYTGRFGTVAAVFLKEALNRDEHKFAFALNAPYAYKNMVPFKTQPTDSLFKPMMHRSDNFFAEQTLLMASNEHLGYMSDEKIIDTLLKTDLKDIPQKPKWVDGSGLSRYNLFTPQSFVYILNKTKNEFGWERLKNILPTGGTGTLSSYYKKDSGFIYAKTGTLSNNSALSGFLITQKGKLLIFSVLANNYLSGATPVRRAVEKFLLAIREKY